MLDIPGIVGLHLQRTSEDSSDRTVIMTVMLLLIIWGYDCGDAVNSRPVFLTPLVPTR